MKLNPRNWLPESNAPKATKRAILLGYAIYGLHALGITLGLTLIILERAHRRHYFAAFALVVLIFYFAVFNPLYALTQIYKEKQIKPRTFATHFIPATIAGLVPPFILLTVYNAAFAAYYYKYRTVFTDT